MEQKQQIEATMERLKYKVSRYEEAVETLLDGMESVGYTIG